MLMNAQPFLKTFARVIGPKSWVVKRTIRQALEYYENITFAPFFVSGGSGTTCDRHDDHHKGRPSKKYQRTRGYNWEHIRRVVNRVVPRYGDCRNDDGKKLHYYPHAINQLKSRVHDEFNQLESCCKGKTNAEAVSKSIASPGCVIVGIAVS